jgi:hypothetical protein
MEPPKCVTIIVMVYVVILGSHVKLQLLYTWYY